MNRITQFLRDRPGKYIFAFCLGLIITYYVYYTIFFLEGLSKSLRWFFIVVIFLIFSLLSYTILRISFSRLQKHGFRKEIGYIWFGMSCLVGFLVFQALPGSLPAIVHENQSLKITATGEKQTQSTDKKVWLLGIYTPGGIRLDTNWQNDAGKWRSIEDFLVAMSEYPAKLKFQVPYAEYYRLVFKATPDSGRVLLSWNGVEQTIDLYSPVENWNVIGLAPQTKFPILYKISYEISASVSFGILVFLVSVILATLTLRAASPKRPSVWLGLLFAVPVLMVGFLYLLAFWPGIMSPDSIDQWRQLLRFSFYDHHPVFHTLFLWLVTRLWLSPAMVVLVQIILLSILVAWSFVRFQQLGFPVWICLIALIILLVLPSVPFINITLWKDTTYGLAFLAFTLLVLEIVVSQGRWLNSTWAIVVFGIVAALVGLVRHNGWPVSLGTILILAVAFRKVRWRLMLAFAISLGLIFGVKTLEYRTLKVIPMGTLMKNVFQIHLIGAHLQAGTPLTSDEKEYLEKIRPIDDGWTYNCYTVDSIVYNPFFAQIPNQVVGADLLKLSIHLTMRNPLVTIKHITCSSSLAWRLRTEPMMNFATIPFFGKQVMQYITPDEVAKIIEEPRLPGLQKYLVNYFEWTRQDRLIGIFWRPVIPIFLLLLGLTGLALRQKSSKYLFIGLPVFMAITGYFLAPNAQDFRYLYPVVLVCLIFWPILYFPINRFCVPGPSPDEKK